MGTSGSKHDAALVSWDASKVDVSFNKILTNSELTVGNREVVELSKQKRNGGIHIKENGPVTIQVPFEFAADLSDLKQLYEQFKSKKIFNLKPKVAKIITKGGDPGRSIIVEQADAGIRKEIRCSERSVLEGEDKKTYESIEKDLLDFVQDHVNKQFAPVAVTIDDSLFTKFKSDDATTPFCLCYYIGKDNAKQKKNLLLVLAHLDKKTIDNVHIPRRDNVYLAVCEYSVLDDEDGGDKQLLIVAQPLALSQVAQGQKYTMSLADNVLQFQ